VAPHEAVVVALTAAVVEAAPAVKNLFPMM
jgi:hypothetical protein